MYALILTTVLGGAGPIILAPMSSGGVAPSGAYSGTCTGDAVVYDNNGVAGCQRTADVAPQSVMIRPQPAFPGGTQTASKVVIAGGPDETTVGIELTPDVNCAGDNDTVTVTVRDSNGTSTGTTLTEGTNWTASASVANTCASLATAVDALAGVGATCTSPNVLITIDLSTSEVTLTESTAACTTVGVGTRGTVEVRGPATFSGTVDASAGTVTFQSGWSIGGNTMIVGSSAPIYWGSHPSFILAGNTSNDQAVIGTHSSYGNSLHYVAANTYSSDCTSADQTNPTLYVHSNTDCATSKLQEGNISHDTANVVAGAGTGVWTFPQGRLGGVNAVTGADTLNVNDCGRITSVTAGIDTATITLPAVSGVTDGCEFYIHYIGASGGALVDITPNSADGIYGGCDSGAAIVTFSGTDDADIGLTKVSGVKGDSITLVKLDSTGWFVRSCRGIWANN